MNLMRRPNGIRICGNSARRRISTTIREDAGRIRIGKKELLELGITLKEPDPSPVIVPRRGYQSRHRRRDQDHLEGIISGHGDVVLTADIDGGWRQTERAWYFHASTDVSLPGAQVLNCVATVVEDTPGHWQRRLASAKESPAVNRLQWSGVHQCYVTPHGQPYTIRAILKGPNGEAASGVSVWFIQAAAQVPHFVTAYPRRWISFGPLRSTYRDTYTRFSRAGHLTTFDRRPHRTNWRKLHRIRLGFFRGRWTEKPKGRRFFLPTGRRFLAFLDMCDGCGMENSAV
jgi:hypothetical protein